MSNHELSTNTEILNNPHEIGERQRILGAEWANLYAKHADKHSFKNAEIVLRNPIVYLQGLHPDQLPKEIEERWSKLLDFSEDVVSVASSEDKEWSAGTTGIEKLQTLMFSGSVNPEYRGSISDILRLSSELFAESTAIIPGDSKYFAGNVRGMEGWINSHRSLAE